MTWLIGVLLFLVLVLAGVLITLAVRLRRHWSPMVRAGFQQARQQWLHLPRKRRRQTQAEQPADFSALLAKIADVKTWLGPKTLGVQLTPLALMLELRALEKGLSHLAVEQRVSESDVFYYGDWMRTLEKSIRSCSWLTAEPTAEEKQLRERTHILLVDLSRRLGMVPVAKEDVEYRLASGAIALLVLQNGDAKVSATMCLDYARYVDTRIQALEAKYGTPASSAAQSQPASAPRAGSPNEQPLVRRLQGARPVPSSQRASVPVSPQMGQHPLTHAERGQEQQRPPEAPNEQSLHTRRTSAPQPRPIASGEVSTNDRPFKNPPVAAKQQRPRTSF